MEVAYMRKIHDSTRERERVYEEEEEEKGVQFSSQFTAERRFGHSFLGFSSNDGRRIIEKLMLLFILHQKVCQIEN